MEIIPVINAENFEEIKEKISLLESLGNGVSKWVHLDVADGTFTKNTIWHNPEDLLGLQTTLKIEVHLMILKPEERIESWLLENVKRIIFNLEGSGAPDFIIEKCREKGIEVGVSIGPDTPWTQAQPFLKKADLIQVLSVYPGLAGQGFIEDSLDKIKHLRENCPDCRIEVDGGINPETTKKAVGAGADILVSASYIFGGGDSEIKNRIESLRKAVS